MDFSAILEAAVALLGLAAKKGSETVGEKVGEQLGERIASELELSTSDPEDQLSGSRRTQMERFLKNRPDLQVEIENYLDQYPQLPAVQQGDGSVAFFGSQHFKSNDMKFGGIQGDS